MTVSYTHLDVYKRQGNRRATITYSPQMPQSLRDWFKPFQKTSHIYRLYLHYCYLLGVLPKKTTYRPTSPYLKEDLKKLEELSEQVRYMSKYGIETFDDLYADRKRLQGEMDKLIAYRTKLQNKIRRASPAEKETLRREKSGVTERITELRKQLKLNKGIEERSVKIQEKTDLLYACLLYTSTELEREFIRLLQELGYEYLPIHKVKDLVDNLRLQLEAVNGYRFSDGEWGRFFSEVLANPKSGIVEKTRLIQEDFVQVLRRDDGSSKNITLFDKKNIHNCLLYTSRCV